MFASVDRRLARLHPVWVSIVALLGVLGVGSIDYLTGYEISLSILYLAPVAFAAWYGGRHIGTAIAVVSAAVWFMADVGLGHAYTHPAIPVWNALVRLGIFLIVSALLGALQARLTAAQSLALHDPLTGLLNSRGFAQRVEYTVALARREVAPFTVAYLDLDNFKQINDEHGHGAGDRLLQAVAKALKEGMRESDAVARLGGDEFAVLLPDTDAAGAQVLVSKLWRAVQLAVAGSAAGCSIGVVTFTQPPMGAELVIRAADRLMYEVKNRGKNAIAHRSESTLGTTL